MKERLVYKDDTHEYFLDGQLIPSVTQIASAVTGKDMSRIPAATLKAAEERGKAIHKDVETRSFSTPEGKWIKAQLWGDYDHEVKGFYADKDGMDHLFAGTCDLLSVNGDGEIADIKSQAEKDILYWTIQLNLYRVIWPRPGLRVLHVPKSGNYQVVPIAVLSDAQMHAIFEAYAQGKTLPADFLAAPAEAEHIKLELVVSKKNLGELVTNANELLAAVKIRCAQYQPENYTEDTVDAAKRDKAELNAFAKAINDRRLELEREFNKPFAEFKDIAASIVSEVKSASARIDSVVKGVEEKRISTKQGLIQDAWAKLAFDKVRLEQVYDPRWENKTYSIKDVEKDMAAKIETIKGDLATLERINEPEAVKHYLITLNMTEALRRADELKAISERIAADKAAPVEPAPEPEIVHEMAFAPQPAADTEIIERIMRVRGTREQIDGLVAYMKASKLWFKKVEGVEA